MKRKAAYQPGRLLTKGIIGAGIALLSCIEQFSLDIDRLGNNYVVEAILLDDPRFQKVVLSKIDAAGNKAIFFGGEVLLERKDLPSILFNQNETGDFLASQFIELVTGDQYRLSIRPNDNEMILSSWETVPERTLIKSGQWRAISFSYINDNGIQLTRNGVEFLVDTDTLPENEVFLRYTYETTHLNEAPFHGSCDCRNCYIKTTPTNYLTISRSENAKGKRLSGQFIEFLPITKIFSLRLTMLVRQITLTRNAYTFYQSVSDQQKLDGSIFDPPPSPVNGNLSIAGPTEARAYGLFEVGRLHETAIDVYNGYLENEFVTYADICLQAARTGNTVPRECFNCFVEPGGGPRPYYFEP